MMQTGDKGWPQSSAGMDKAFRREQLSALADGELQGEEWAAALEFAVEAEGRATWQMYHLVGDVLRSSDLAQPAPSDLMEGLRERLSRETPVLRSPAPFLAQERALPLGPAANASVFRWKMVAGLASLTAVAVIGWTSLASLQDTAAPDAQLAQSSERSVAQVTPVVAAADADAQQVMIRDPRLDELLAAHKQFGSTSALQMPAGFLRNATFETPGR